MFTKPSISKNKNRIWKGILLDTTITIPRVDLKIIEIMMAEKGLQVLDNGISQSIIESRSQFPELIPDIKAEIEKREKEASYIYVGFDVDKFFNRYICGSTDDNNDDADLAEKPDDGPKENLVELTVDVSEEDLQILKMLIGKYEWLGTHSDAVSYSIFESCDHYLELKPEFIAEIEELESKSHWTRIYDLSQFFKDLCIKADDKGLVNMVEMSFDVDEKCMKILNAMIADENLHVKTLDEAVHYCIQDVKNMMQKN